MSALVLKLIAMAIMLVDHSGIVLYRLGVTSWVTYRAMRIIGRGAFPIFCFQIAEGARYSKNKAWYAGRLLILGLISEAFFDLAVFADWYYPDYQNVFFTLLLGLLVIYVMQWAAAREGSRKIPAFALAACALVAACFLAEFLHTDYGMKGVLQIAVMGLLALPYEKLEFVRIRGFSDRFIRVVVCAAGILVCAMLAGGSEWAAFYALIPIGFYNGKRGYSGKAPQYALYFFYPVHLLLLGLLYLALR